MKIKQILIESKKILLVAHHNPDADALGSMLGMYEILVHHWGLSVEMAVDGVIPSNLSYLPYFFLIQDGFRPERFDTVVLLDCGGWSRTNFFETDELNIDWPNNLIVIDHHATSAGTPGVHYIDTSASSTSEILWKLIKTWGLQFNSKLATCLLTGIMFDTGSFQHSNTGIETFQAAAELLASGADFSGIRGGLYVKKSQALLKLWGTALKKMKYDHKRKLATSYVSVQDFKRCNATATDLEGLTNLMSTIPDVKFALLLSEGENGVVKGSLRTEQNNINVKNLAEAMGGGGHIKAAGFTLPARIEVQGGAWRVV